MMYDMYGNMMPESLMGTRKVQEAPRPGQAGSYKTSYGSIAMARIPQIIGIGIVLTCLFCYYMSQIYHEEDPFPGATITMTASHYPQSVVFRLNMLIISGATVMLWSVIYAWLKMLSLRYNVSVLGTWVYKLCILGSVLFAVAVATIDTGFMNDTLHSGSAVGFFVIWVLCICVITLKIIAIRAKAPEVTSLLSIGLKVAICLFMLGTAAVQLYKMFKPTEENMDPEIPVLEWFVTFAMAAWIYTFQFEWTQFYLNLDGPELALVSLDVYAKQHAEFAAYSNTESQSTIYE